MSISEWLLVVAAWAVPVGGLVVWVIGIRETAQKNAVEIGEISRRLGRGDALFDELREDVGEIRERLARIEALMGAIRDTLEGLKKRRNEGGAT